MTLTRKKWLGAAVTAGAFGVFLFLALHKLTHASVWLDEAIEFWYSKVAAGPLPFEASSGMIERINSTFQPPLYNFLMHLWLMVDTGEWWFRFFSVVVGFVGMIGLFKTTLRLTENVFAAAASVAFAAFIYQLVYYWQEAAEYCLLVSAVFWALYFWVCLLKAPSRRNVIGLTVAAVVAVYSQYGAVFPVFVMLVTALAAVLKRKDKKLTLTLVVSWSLALLLAALPLYLFFFAPQFAGQHGGGLSLSSIRFFRNNILIDFVGGAAAVFQWNVSLYLPNAATVLILGLFLLLAAVMFFRGSRFLRILIACNLLLWIVYYVALKLNLYAYGHFRGRYAIFFIPCWLVLAVAMLYEAYGLLKARGNGGRPLLTRAFLVLLAACCGAYCFFSWRLVLRDNWEKEDNRTAAEVWQRENPEGRDTVVYYGATAGFSYYTDRNWSGERRENIHYLPWSLRGLTVGEYDAYFTGLYGEAWPSEVWFIANHISGDLNTMLSAFEARGYQRDERCGNTVVRLTRAD